MAKRTAPLLPSTDELLRQFGDRLRVARLRRRVSAKQVAERAGMSPMTLRSLERGGSGVTIGAYLAVMQVLGLEKDLNLIGKADPVGRELQDAHLTAHRKTTRVPVSLPVKRQTPGKVPIGDAVTELPRVIKGSPQEQLRKRESLGRLDAQAKETRKQLKPLEDAPGWIKQSGFASSEVLARLIDPLAPSSKKRR